MNALPKWVLANPFPAIHDFESLTVIDQTARIYGAMNGLINEYNAFADQVNKQLSEFTGTEENARKEFELQITKVIREFMCSMEQRTADMNLYARDAINEAIQNGTMTIMEIYNPETESLDMVIGGSV